MYFAAVIRCDIPFLASKMHGAHSDEDRFQAGINCELQSDH
jgi:hypothetical protein